MSKIKTVLWKTKFSECENTPVMKRVLFVSLKANIVPFRARCFVLYVLSLIKYLKTHFGLAGTNWKQARFSWAHEKLTFRRRASNRTRSNRRMMYCYPAAVQWKLLNIRCRLKKTLQNGRKKNLGAINEIKSSRTLEAIIEAIFLR